LRVGTVHAARIRAAAWLPLGAANALSTMPQELVCARIADGVLAMLSRIQAMLVQR
jgi:hypothetical protein|tara:strand:+ start:4121 stop:4288 length:168 start_codon:yes stop_codon:yes gene_type:complete